MHPNSTFRTIIATGACCLACILMPSLAIAGPPLQETMRDGQHDFDDSFGTWQVHISRLAQPLSASTTWLEYEGRHTITPIWNGRGSVGTLLASGSAGNIEAMSPRLYNPATRQWSLRYASSRDGELGVAHIGQFRDGRGVFIAHDTLGARPILVRNLYWAETADLHHFEVAYSADGGLNWETNWKMTETRIANVAALALSIPPHSSAPSGENQ